MKNADAGTIGDDFLDRCKINNPELHIVITIINPLLVSATDEKTDKREYDYNLFHVIIISSFKWSEWIVLPHNAV